MSIKAERLVLIEKARSEKYRCKSPKCENEATEILKFTGTDGETISMDMHCKEHMDKLFAIFGEPSEPEADM